MPPTSWRAPSWPQRFRAWQARGEHRHPPGAGASRSPERLLPSRNRSGSPRPSGRSPWMKGWPRSCSPAIRPSSAMTFSTWRSTAWRYSFLSWRVSSPTRQSCPSSWGAAGRPRWPLFSAGLRSALAEDASSLVCIVSSNMASYMSGKDTDSECASMEELLANGDWRALISRRAGKRSAPAEQPIIAALICLAGRGRGSRSSTAPPHAKRKRTPSARCNYAAIGLGQ